jgi:membrane protein
VSQAGRLIGVFSAAAGRFFGSGASHHAAAIAYYVLFSLAPLAIVLVSVFSLVLQNDELRDTVVTKVVDALPVDTSGSADVEDAIEEIATPASAAGLVSLVVFLWAASGMMSAIRRGLEHVMGVEEGRPMLRGKLIDFALVGGTAVLVMVSVGVGLVTQFVNRLVGELAGVLGVEGDAAERTLSTALPFLVWVLTALLVYRFVPAARLRFRDALAGAIVTAVLLLGISLAADLVYAKTTEWSIVYGSLTSLLVFLYSVYLYSSALLLGAAVAIEWPKPHVSDGEPFGRKVRRAARGLFVRDRPS